MPKFEVTLEDGRKTESYAPDERGAAAQAEHWDRDRFVINVKRNQDPGPSPSKAAEVRRVKD